MLVWLPHDFGPELLGELPDGVEIEVWDGSGPLLDSAAHVEFFVPPFLSGAPAGVMTQLASVRVVQLLSAGADAYVPHVLPGVTLCDAQGVHTAPTAEWVCAAVLASIRELPQFFATQTTQTWDTHFTSELSGSTVLIVGYGDIGAGIEARLAPFDVDFLRVARTAKSDPDVRAVAELPELLPLADVVIVIVPLTGDTRGMVNAEFLSRMKDGALLVNAARGPVVVTDDLIVALESGRIRAALDVTDPEPLPAGHRLWSAPGLLLTPHVAGSVSGLWRRAYALVGEQLRRYCAGEALRGVVTEQGY